VRTGRFPDDDSRVRLCETAHVADAYVLQPTSPPADQHLFRLLLIADAARRAGAARITAVVPYLGYARQDRRSAGRGAVAARVVSDMIDSGGVDRLVTVDVHTPAIEGFLSCTGSVCPATPDEAHALSAARLLVPLRPFIYAAAQNRTLRRRALVTLYGHPGRVSDAAADQHLAIARVIGHREALARRGNRTRILRGSACLR
jgi:ribose-phosphate pyrophosphokinase